MFGYDIVDKKLTINTYEADIVRDMFTRYKNGEKAKEIIARLNGQGIHVNFITITSVSEENATNTVVKRQITDSKILKICYSARRLNTFCNPT